jgi:hypothetical protein
MKRAMLLCGVLCAAPAAHVQAWESNGHMRLTALLQSLYPTSPLTTALCAHVKKWRTADGKEHQAWANERCIIVGSDDPDRYRGFLQQRSHHDRGNERSRNAFCAAVRAAFQGGHKDPHANMTEVPPNNPQAIAAYRLGTALHYLQDMGDPTKEMIGGYRKEVRDRQAELIAGALRVPQAVWYQSTNWEQFFQNQSIPVMLQTMDRYRDESGRILQQLREVRQRLPAQEHYRRLDEQIWFMTHMTLAAQKRMVLLFDAYVRGRQGCEPALDVAIETEMTQPETTAQPQAPQQPYRPPPRSTGPSYDDLNRR